MCEHLERCICALTMAMGPTEVENMYGCDVDVSEGAMRSRAQT
jgi:hypothetical protein